MMDHVRALGQIAEKDQGRRVKKRVDPQHVIRMAQSLPVRDREFIEARFGEGLTYPQMARRFRSNAGRVRRRVERLLERMQAPEYRFVCLHGKDLPRSLRLPGRLVFVQGRSLRDTAKAAGTTLHRVRCDCARLKTLARLGM